MVEFLRVVQEFNDFFEFFFCFINVSDIIKGYVVMFFGQYFGFGFVKVYCIIFVIVLYVVYEIDLYIDQQKERQQVQDKSLKVGLFLCFGFYWYVLGQ